MKKIISVMIIMLILSACSNENYQEEQNKYSRYSIFSVQNNTFVSTDYYSESTDTMILVEEFIGELGLTKTDKEQLLEVYVEKCNISNKVAYVYFNSAYSRMDNIYEALFRASVVNTLVQLEEIDYVYFYVDNKSLTFKNGQIVGLMSEDDFITDSDNDLNSLAWEKVTLYFSNMEGTGLVPREIEVAYDKTISLEELVVEQLIQGPEDDSCKAVLLEQVKVLGIYVNEGVCYVNLDESFIKNSVDVPFQITLYSVVNSLCELSNIYKVQFQINGDSHLEVEGFSFDTYYERNLDLIEQEVLQN